MSKYLIIGASAGIGKQLALQLMETGHQVIGTYFKNSLHNLPKDIEMHPLNVMDETIDLNFIPDQLDGLVYCPGSILLKPFARLNEKDLLQDFRLQILGAINCIQIALPKLKNSDKASIVLFSTVAVQVGMNFHSQVAISKGAIEALTKALAAEFSPKIRVNCIAPSLTDTPLAAALLNSEEKRDANAQRHPLKKIGQPQDIANMAEFLLSEKTGWMTGQIIHVDGGLSTLKI